MANKLFEKKKEKNIIFKSDITCNKIIESLVEYKLWNDFFQNIEIKNMFSPEKPLVENSEICEKEGNKITPANRKETASFFNAAIYLNRTNLLYSKAGDGKTDLSIEIGKSYEYEKCLYILADNSREEKYYIHTERLGGKAIIISLKNIMRRVEMLNNDIVFMANFESSIMYDKLDENREYFWAEKIIKICKKKHGVKNQDRKSINEIDALEAIIFDAITIMGIDFICIDSLNGLFLDSCKLNRKLIRRILQKAVEHNITILCLHHTNSNDKMSGPSAIREEFEYVYKLYVVDNCSNNEMSPRTLIIDEEKARYSKQQRLRFSRCFQENNTIPIYELIDIKDYYKKERNKNLLETIKEIIDGWNEDTIMLTELTEQLNKIQSATTTTIKNKLKELADNDFIKMEDGRHWNKIKIIKE